MLSVSVTIFLKKIDMDHLVEQSDFRNLVKRSDNFRNMNHFRDRIERGRPKEIGMCIYGDRYLRIELREICPLIGLRKLAKLSLAYRLPHHLSVLIHVEFHICS